MQQEVLGTMVKGDTRMTCKRSKQCDHADLCRFAQSDDYNLLGGSCFTLKDPQTNEEWFDTLSTEEKAKRIINIAVNSDCDYRTIVEWLKQPHR